MVPHRKIDTGVLDTTCRRLKQELGCSDERAFELLYGWCVEKEAHSFGLTQVAARATPIVVRSKKKP